MRYLYWFLLNWVVNIIFIEFCTIRKVAKIVKVNEERDSKYPAYRRIDTFWLNRPWLYLTCHLSVFKVVFAFANLFLCATVTTIAI
jgi:hypothetical protein